MSSKARRNGKRFSARGPDLGGRNPRRQPDPSSCLGHLFRLVPASKLPMASHALGESDAEWERHLVSIYREHDEPRERVAASLVFDLAVVDWKLKRAQSGEVAALRMKPDSGSGTPAVKLAADVSASAFAGMKGDPTVDVHSTQRRDDEEDEHDAARVRGLDIAAKAGKLIRELVKQRADLISQLRELAKDKRQIEWDAEAATQAGNEAQLKRLVIAVDHDLLEDTDAVKQLATLLDIKPDAARRQLERRRQRPVPAPSPEGPAVGPPITESQANSEGSASSAPTGSMAVDRTAHDFGADAKTGRVVSVTCVRCGLHARLSQIYPVCAGVKAAVRGEQRKAEKRGAVASRTQNVVGKKRAARKAKGGKDG